MITKNTHSNAFHFTALMLEWAVSQTAHLPLTAPINNLRTICDINDTNMKKNAKIKITKFIETAFVVDESNKMKIYSVIPGRRLNHVTHLQVHIISSLSFLLVFVIFSFSFSFH